MILFIWGFGSELISLEAWIYGGVELTVIFSFSIFVTVFSLESTCMEDIGF